jgi:hypothetical protein
MISFYISLEKEIRYTSLIPELIASGAVKFPFPSEFTKTDDEWSK